MFITQLRQLSVSLVSVYRAEYRQMFGNIHQTAHYAGLIGSIFVLAWSVDPQGALDQFSGWIGIRTQFCVNSTCLAWMVAICVNYFGLRDDWSLYYGFFLLYLAFSFGACARLFIHRFLSIRSAISPYMPFRDSTFIMTVRK
jgi:hypothetical protein